MRGIDVFLHWTWIILAIYEIQGDDRYSQPFWRAIEYVTIFGIVLVHEFGHALACRQVGGTANRIVLWPLGGIAYVNPPPRPWPYLWSILAGPLVNLALAPVLLGVLFLTVVLGWRGAFPDADQFLFMICFTNLVMLVFNLLPVFPLDGGQILRGLLWLVIGRAASLMVAAILGFVVALGMIAVSLHSTEWWLALMAFLGMMASVSGLRRAMLIMSSRQAARYEDRSCPKCRHGAPIGKFFSCAQCSRRFDPFQTPSCPQCGRLVNEVLCLECERSSPIQEWGSEQPCPEPSLPPVRVETCASAPSREDENRKSIPVRVGLAVQGAIVAGVAKAAFWSLSAAMGAAVLGSGYALAFHAWDTIPGLVALVAIVAGALGAIIGLLDGASRGAVGERVRLADAFPRALTRGRVSRSSSRTCEHAD